MLDLKLFAVDFLRRRPFQQGGTSFPGSRETGERNRKRYVIHRDRDPGKRCGDRPIPVQLLYLAGDGQALVASTKN